MDDLRARVAGAMFLLGSCGSTLLHRHIYKAAQHGPPHIEELGVGLLTFVLASIGILLLLHGSKLFRRSVGPVPPNASAPSRREWEVERLLAAGSPEAMLLDTRHGVALLLAYRALAAAAERRSTSSERLFDKAQLAYRRSIVRGL